MSSRKRHYGKVLTHGFSARNSLRLMCKTGRHPFGSSASRAGPPTTYPSSQHARSATQAFDESETETLVGPSDKPQPPTITTNVAYKTTEVEELEELAAQISRMSEEVAHLRLQAKEQSGLGNWLIQDTCHTNSVADIIQPQVAAEQGTDKSDGEGRVESSAPDNPEREGRRGPAQNGKLETPSLHSSTHFGLKQIQSDQIPHFARPTVSTLGRSHDTLRSQVIHNDQQSKISPGSSRSPGSSPTRRHQSSIPKRTSLPNSWLTPEKKTSQSEESPEQTPPTGSSTKKSYMSPTAATASKAKISPTSVKSLSPATSMQLPITPEYSRSLKQAMDAVSAISYSLALQSKQSARPTSSHSAIDAPWCAPSLPSSPVLRAMEKHSHSADVVAERVPTPTCTSESGSSSKHNDSDKAVPRSAIEHRSSLSGHRKSSYAGVLCGIHKPSSQSSNTENSCNTAETDEGRCAVPTTTSGTAVMSDDDCNKAGGVETECTPRADETTSTTVESRPDCDSARCEPEEEEEVVMGACESKPDFQDITELAQPARTTPCPSSLIVEAESVSELDVRTDTSATDPASSRTSPCKVIRGKPKVLNAQAQDFTPSTARPCIPRSARCYTREWAAGVSDAVVGQIADEDWYQLTQDERTAILHARRHKHQSGDLAPYSLMDDQHPVASPSPSDGNEASPDAIPTTPRYQLQAKRGWHISSSDVDAQWSGGNGREIRFVGHGPAVERPHFDMFEYTNAQNGMMMQFESTSADYSPAPHAHMHQTARLEAAMARGYPMVPCENFHWIPEGVASMPGPCFPCMTGQ